MISLTNLEGIPPIETKVRWFSTSFGGAISQKRCKIKPRSQLSTNRKVIYGLLIGTKVDDLE